MQLRQLKMEHERQIFELCLAKARATRGVGFREARRSQVGRAHIVFGDLYAIYETPDDPVEKMLGGFIVHDLGTMPQSHPKTDLSHLPPHSIIEGSELWSLTPGLIKIAAAAAGAVAGLMQAKAILVYPMSKPADLTQPYLRLKFVNACEAVRWPYTEGTEGQEVWAQPMVLTGEPLEDYIRMGFELLFQSQGEAGMRLAIPAAPQAPKPVTPAEIEVRRETLVIANGLNGHDQNGSAAPM